MYKIFSNFWNFEARQNTVSASCEPTVLIDISVRALGLSKFLVVPTFNYGINITETNRLISLQHCKTNTVLDKN